MSDIFREVEEDLRREQLKRLWDRFGMYVILAAVLIVAATAGWRGWLWYSERQARAAGENYEAAVALARQGEHERAAAELSEIATSASPFAGFARLRAAGEQAAAGDTEVAVAAYEAIAGDSGASTHLRAAARIRAGYLLVDTAEQSEIEQRVGDLAGDGDPWRHSAREILGLAAYRAGDFAAAAERFEAILGDDQAPANIRSRAELMIALVAAERPAGTTEDGAAAEAGTEEEGVAEQ